MTWPLDYLCGMYGPHPANDKKGIIFINKKKKRTLKNMNLWIDEEYLQRKEERTVRDHKRDVIPNCRVIFLAWCTILAMHIISIFHAGNSWA